MGGIVSVGFGFHAISILEGINGWYGELIHYNMTEMTEDFLMEDVQEGDCSIP